MPHPLHQPQRHGMARHAAVVPVLAVEGGVVEQGARREVLLQHAVDEDGHGGVNGVEKEEEQTVEEGLGAVVGEEHEEELTCHKNTLINSHEASSHRFRKDE